MTADVLLDIGLSGDGRIVLRIHDIGLPAETEIIMSLAEARAMVAALVEAITTAEALPEGRQMGLGLE